MAAWIDSPGLTTWVLEPPAQALPAGRPTSRLRSIATVILVQRRMGIPPPLGFRASRSGTHMGDVKRLELIVEKHPLGLALGLSLA
jgi:hypothetical protein